MIYKVLSSFDSDQLSERVNDAIKQGWTLLGGLTPTTLAREEGKGQAVYFSQAMVLYPIHPGVGSAE